MNDALLAMLSQFECSSILTRDCLKHARTSQRHPLSFEFTPSATAIEPQRNAFIDNHPLLKVAERPVFPAHTRQHSDASLHLESVLPHNVECNAPPLPPPRDNNDSQVSETSTRTQTVKRLNPSTGKRYVRNPVPRKEKAALKMLFIEDRRPGPERIEEIAKMLQLDVRKKRYKEIPLTTTIRTLEYLNLAHMIWSHEKELADMATGYIEQVSGVSLPTDASLHAALKDGVILCKLINSLGLTEPIKISESPKPFKQMENISNFLNRIEKIGVPSHERFMTVDLYEAKNLGQVVNCIFSLSRHASRKGHEGPVLGPKLVERRERHFSAEKLREARFTPSTLFAFSTTVSSSLGYRQIGGIRLH
ncbi:Muscle-specific protein 20 [Chytriomyces hyalinus]|nr:Muscle-specific protein 20 [Chytriomyces hyalinus]